MKRSKKLRIMKITLSKKPRSNKRKKIINKNILKNCLRSLILRIRQNPLRSPT